MSSSHLSLVRKPYKYPLGVRVRASMDLDSHLSPLEKERERLSFYSSKAYTLECQDHNSSHQAQDLR